MRCPPHVADNQRWINCLLAFWLSVLCILLSACTPALPAPTTTSTALPPAEPAQPQSEGSADIERSTGDTIAVFTFVEGDVFVEDRRVVPFASIQSGSRVRAEAGGLATIVCSNNRVIQVLNAGEVVVNSQSCNRGGMLPGNGSSRVTPSNGQIKVNDGSFDLEEDAREQEGDYGNIPIILNPRNTALLDREPALQWVEVASTLEHVLSLSGPGAFEEITLEADTVDCAENPGTSPNRVCTTPWPASDWPLQPGKRYFLTVSARTGLAAPLRDSEKSNLSTLDAEAARQVRDEAAAIQALALDPVTTNLLLAGLYAEQKLYERAIPRYQQVLAVQPAPIVHSALGDAYRAIDLQRYAFAAYQDALQLLDQTGDDPAVRATAEFGMGQVEYSRMNFTAAEPHFAQAVELYTQIGAKEEIQAAQKALQETRVRL